MTPNFFPSYFHPSKENIDDLFNQITTLGVVGALWNTSMCSALGGDNIPWRMVVAIHNTIPETLCNIYTSILLHEIHPIKWKTAKCILIP